MTEEDLGKQNFFFFFVVLEFQLRNSCLQGKKQNFCINHRNILTSAESYSVNLRARQSIS
jgi:hypothetical protein